MRVSPTSVQVLGFLSVVVILGGGYVFGISSRTIAEDHAASLRTQVASLEREDRANDSRAMELRAQIERIEGSSETGQSLRHPDARNSVLADIAQVISDHGLQIDELTPGAPVAAGETSQESPEDLILTTPITLRARGRMGDALRAITAIHQTMGGVEVRTLTLTGDPFSTEQGMVSIGFLWYADRSE